MVNDINKDNDWTPSKITQAWEIIDELAKRKYKLDYYEPRFEMITHTHMLNIYSSYGMPNLYKHWSFGKAYSLHQEEYKQNGGQLAYEVVLNTNPSLVYLMENNSMMMQWMTMAHAAVGHSSFYKNNYLFKQFTNANTILSTLEEGQRYIKECELKYGVKRVEGILDACHSLGYYAVDKYPTKFKTNKSKKKQLANRKDNKHRIYNEVMDKSSSKKYSSDGKSREYKYPYSEENILKFIEQHSPALAPWQRNIIKIVRDLHQYLYPQMLTKMMNEGWASFWHYILMHDLYDEGHLPESYMFEFLDSHTSVIASHGRRVSNLTSPRLNPYNLGFNMFMDIKRICENPTEEDKEFAPDLIGKNWIEAVHEAMENYKDESFILQYLSPTVIRKLNLFQYRFDENSPDRITITEVQDDLGYNNIRRALAKQHNLEYWFPPLRVIDDNLKSDRQLMIMHKVVNNHKLNEKYCYKTLKYIRRLWGYSVTLLVTNTNIGDWLIKETIE